MRTEFPYRISEQDGLPEPFADVSPAAIETVFVPPQGFGSRWDRQEEPARALALGKEQVWVLEETKGGVARREVFFDDLVEIELGNVLLHAWVAFTPDDAGPVRLDFNTVAFPIFEHLTGLIFEHLRGDDDSVASSGTLDELPLKFRNAVRDRLLPGENLEAVAFAPAVWGRRFLVLRRRLVAATALVVTGWRLLVIEEGEAVGDNTYGSTACSIRRDRVSGIRLTAEGVAVSCRFRGGARERGIPFSDPGRAADVIKEMGGTS